MFDEDQPALFFDIVLDNPDRNSPVRSITVTGTEEVFSPFETPNPEDKNNKIFVLVDKRSKDLFEHALPNMFAAEHINEHWASTRGYEEYSVTPANLPSVAAALVEHEMIEAGFAEELCRKPSVLHGHTCVRSIINDNYHDAVTKFEFMGDSFNDGVCIVFVNSQLYADLLVEAQMAKEVNHYGDQFCVTLNHRHMAAALINLIEAGFAGFDLYVQATNSRDAGRPITKGTLKKDNQYYEEPTVINRDFSDVTVKSRDPLSPVRQIRFITRSGNSGTLLTFHTSKPAEVIKVLGGRGLEIPSTDSTAEVRKGWIGWATTGVWFGGKTHSVHTSEAVTDKQLRLIIRALSNNGLIDKKFEEQLMTGRQKPAGAERN